MLKSSENEKSAPCPKALQTLSSPPINSTSCLLIASPRPVPSKARVKELSTCEKGENSVACCADEIPIPESDNENSSFTESSQLAWTLNDLARSNLVDYRIGQ